MSRNVEVKARIDDLAPLEARVQSIADHDPTAIYQDDTFFHCETGRLKLRKFSDGRGELIFYRRGDTEGPKESFYLRSETTMPDVLAESLALAYGVSGRVEKHRVLYLVGRTRVHLDRVTDLGEYLELEVVMEEGEAVEVGIAEAQALLERLGVGQHCLVQGAYVDLLARGGS
ncbi:MAG: class IV adenylate cyclase [Pseudomonadota bacterium]